MIACWIVESDWFHSWVPGQKCVTLLVGGVDKLRSVFEGMGHEI